MSGALLDELLKEDEARRAGRRPAKKWRGIFDRRAAQEATPWALGALSLLFFALSGASTIVCVGRLMAIGGIPVTPLTAIVVGVVVVVILSTGEVLGAGKPWYWLFLAFDMAFTLWFSWPALLRWSTVAHMGPWGALVLGAIIGYVSARLPEHVFFGSRR
jgi:hypothetical protein